MLVGPIGYEVWSAPSRGPVDGRPVEAPLRQAGHQQDCRDQEEDSLKQVNLERNVTTAISQMSNAGVRGSRWTETKGNVAQLGPGMLRLTGDDFQ